MFFFGFVVFLPSFCFCNFLPSFKGVPEYSGSAPGVPGLTDTLRSVVT